jgi:hypothetical protein
MGLYQLAYLIISDHTFLHPLLNSLLKFRYINGYNFDGSKII